jgi:hypothetical protein
LLLIFNVHTYDVGIRGGGVRKTTFKARCLLCRVNSRLVFQAQENAQNRIKSRENGCEKYFLKLLLTELMFGVIINFPQK